MQECLERLHLRVATAEDCDGALAALREQYFHACVWPVEHEADAARLGTTVETRSATAIVAVGARADTSLVVACMRAGCSNFWPRQPGMQGLAEIVLETLSRTVPLVPRASEIEVPIPGFIGRHPKILEIFKLIQSLRNTDSTVLITGESGTGKEVVARAIHETSPRNRHPFVAVNCGAIPATLLESELFGHVKGAFTGATANRTGRFRLAAAGTLFLDEISDLPFDLQAKILRAIQHRVFEPVGSPHSIQLDARIIAATNQDLEIAVAEKRFRGDLYYRLNVIPIDLPPLRVRKSDIPLMAREFVEKFCRANSKPFPGISGEAMRCLMEYQWPGNVRELENLMERVVVLKTTPGPMELRDLPMTHFRRVRVDRFVANVELPDDGIDFNQAVGEFENELILQALQRTEGNKNQAATLLNLNRTTLVEKLKRKNLRLQP